MNQVSDAFHLGKREGEKEMKEQVIKIVQEISDSPTVPIVQSKFLDYVITVLKEKL